MNIKQRKAIAGIVAEMKADIGNVSALARAAGVGRQAVYHWLDGSAALALSSAAKLSQIATDDQVRRLYAAVGLRLPVCGRCYWRPADWPSRPLNALCDEEGE